MFTSSHHEIVELINSQSWRYQNENDLQHGIASLLTQNGHTVKREVRLSAKDRIDLLVGTIGIEVKVKGQPEKVRQQLIRYAAHTDQLTHLILVTTMAAHAIPENYLSIPATTIILKSYL